MTDEGPRGFVQPSLRPARRLLPALPAASAAAAPLSPENGTPSASLRVAPAEPTGPLGPAPAAPPPVNAPYGMRPGVRHLLPGISNVANAPKRLDTSGDFELVAPSGAVIPIRSQNPRDAAIVTKLGQSLFNGSANDTEKKIAGAVTDWGQSMVGQMPIVDIQKAMAERWDHNVGNVVKRDLGQARIQAAQANRGARNPNLPGKDDAQANKDLFNMEQDVIKQYVASNKGAAINTLLGDFDRLEALISSDSPMAQRIAPMVELLTLTGKASRESEQSGVTQGAGLWDSWKNKLSLLNPNDTSLSDAYRGEFLDYLKTEKEAVMKRKKELATLAANDIAYAVSRSYGPEVAQGSARRVYGNMYGDFASPTFDPDKDASRDTTTPIARPGMARPKAAAPAPAPKAAAPAPAPAKPKAAPAKPYVLPDKYKDL